MGFLEADRKKASPHLREKGRDLSKGSLKPKLEGSLKEGKSLPGHKSKHDHHKLSIYNINRIMQPQTAVRKINGASMG